MTENEIFAELSVELYRIDELRSKLTDEIDELNDEQERLRMEYGNKIRILKEYELCRK